MSADIKSLPDEVVEEWIRGINWSADATDYLKTITAGNIRTFAAFVNRRNDLQSRVETLERIVSDFI